MQEEEKQRLKAEEGMIDKLNEERRTKERTIWRKLLVEELQPKTLFPDGVYVKKVEGSDDLKIGSRLPDMVVNKIPKMAKKPVQ